MQSLPRQFMINAGEETFPSLSCTNRIYKLYFTCSALGFVCLPNERSPQVTFGLF